MLLGGVLTLPRSFPKYRSIFDQDCKTLTAFLKCCNDSHTWSATIAIKSNGLYSSALAASRQGATLISLCPELNQCAKISKIFY